MQIPFLPAEFSSRRPRRPDRRSQRPVGCGDEITFFHKVVEHSQIPLACQGKGREGSGTKRLPRSFFIRGSFDEFRRGLKIFAASCGESSILKGEQPLSFLLAYPAASRGEYARYGYRFLFGVASVYQMEFAFSGISVYDRSPLSLTFYKSGNDLPLGRAGFFRETTTSVR
jgi:hypothetical protein